MSDSEDDPKDRVEPTVAYLQKLGPSHLDLILEASYWVFDIDRSAGLEVNLF